MTLKSVSCVVAITALAVASSASAEEPGIPVLPGALSAVVGCWEGAGNVMGKPVDIALRARLTALGAMLAVETSSKALADPDDRYAAHLLLGTAPSPAEGGAASVVGYWSDSFGGAYTATGEGKMAPDGFTVTYRYPEQDFVNRWHLTEPLLVWEIVARDQAAGEKPFAAYRLRRKQCSPDG